jgi:hypothetical protein
VAFSFSSFLLFVIQKHIPHLSLSPTGSQGDDALWATEVEAVWHWTTMVEAVMAMRGGCTVSASSREANAHSVLYEFHPLGMPSSCSVLDSPVCFTTKCCRAFFVLYAKGGIVHHIPDRVTAGRLNCCIYVPLWSKDLFVTLNPPKE